MICGKSLLAVGILLLLSWQGAGRNNNNYDNDDDGDEWLDGFEGLGLSFTVSFRGELDREELESLPHTPLVDATEELRRVQDDIAGKYIEEDEGGNLEEDDNEDDDWLVFENPNPPPPHQELDDWIAETERNYAARRRLNTFGEEDRVPLSFDEVQRYFPYIGLVSSGCTGTIIDKRLMLTNRHCVAFDPTTSMVSSQFWDHRIYLGTADDFYKYKVYFTKVAVSKEYEDWAIVQLLQPIGLYTGYPGIRKRKQDYFTRSRFMTMVSYSKKFLDETRRPGAHFECTSRGILETGFYNAIRHDCDAERGSSGSPMLEGMSLKCSAKGNRLVVDGNEDSKTYNSLEKCKVRVSKKGPWIVGINYAEFRHGALESLHLNEYSNENANLFWPSSAFFNAAKRARNWRVATRPTTVPTPSPTIPRDCHSGFEIVTPKRSWRMIEDGWEAYPRDVDRCWLIKSPKGLRVDMKVYGVDLDFAVDFLHIYNANREFMFDRVSEVAAQTNYTMIEQDHIKRIKTFTGQMKKGWDLISKHRFVFVRFTSSESSRGFHSGFRLLYKKIK